MMRGKKDTFIYVCICMRCMDLYFADVYRFFSLFWWRYIGLCIYRIFCCLEISYTVIIAYFFPTFSFFFSLARPT